MVKWFGGRDGAPTTWIVALACLLLCTARAPADETPAALLESAWEEYGFQSFTSARKLFAEVAESSDADREQRLQARLGLAFVTHYQMPGRDPEAAVPLYESLLKEASDDPEWRVLLLARLGDCHAEIDPPKLESARQFYRRAMDAGPDTSLMVQETVLRLLTTYMSQPNPEEFARGLVAVEEFAPRIRGSRFESIFHGLIAELAFSLGDLERMVTALDAQYRTGINNVKVREKVLFQLARLHEVELRDFAAAESYYRRLAAEVPSSQKAHFARLRADELRDGKIESAYAPPLPPLVRDLAGEEGVDGR